MVLAITNNLAAMDVYRHLQANSAAMNDSLGKLSSGLRINTAADDAAGLAVSTRLQSQINGMNQAVRNTQDGINVLRTADGALGETDTVLQRMRDLSVEAANTGALDANATAAIDEELGQLKQELDRMAHTTNFNGIPLLDGSFDRLFQLGANAGDTVRVTIPPNGQPLDTSGLGLSTVSATGRASVLTTATPAVSAAQGTPAPGRLTLAGDYVTAGAYAASYKSLVGTVTYNGRSFDLGSVDYTGAVTAQDYIDRLDTAALSALGTSFVPFVGTATGLVFTGATPGPSSTAADAAALTPTYTGQTGPADAIQAIDQAIQQVSSARAYLGAVDNRFQHTVDQLNTAIENTTASASSITDTDMAAEMANFSKSRILVQAGSAMLAQANQTNQGLLRLLG